ncbi:MAG: hypothetical protein K2H60_00975 [Muribaculaceae bacterium]|nr:hypothetical protein [Muribaculaceae bacterium]
MEKLVLVILTLMAMPFIGAFPVCSEEQEKPKVQLPCLLPNLQQTVFNRNVNNELF